MCRTRVEKKLFSIIRRIVPARSAREPAVIVVEDLHWLDGASNRFLLETERGRVVTELIYSGG